MDSDDADLFKLPDCSYTGIIAPLPRDQFNLHTTGSVHSKSRALDEVFVQQNLLKSCRIF